MPVKSFFSAALCVLFVFSVSSGGFTTENTKIFIRVNRVGFAPSDVKTAIVVMHGSLPEQFQVINIKTGAVVFKGDVNPILEPWGQFNVHGELDFSAFNPEGEYVVALGQLASTYFRISRNANTQIPDQLIRKQHLGGGVARR